MKSVRFILVVWGEEFIQTLCEICIPSLLAPGNIPFFSEHYKCKFHIITDKPGKWQLEKASAIENIRKFGDVIIKTSSLDDDHKYKQMSDLQNIGVKAAYENGDALGFLFVDGIWARDSFREFVEALNQGYKAVGSWNMRSNKPDMIRDVIDGGYLNNGVLDISTEDLAALIFKNLHRHMSYRFWEKEPSQEHCGQLFHRLSDDVILVHTFLIIPYIIFPEVMAEIPADPNVRGVSNTYMDIFLAQVVPNPGDVYIAKDSRTHLNVELSPKDTSVRKRRPNDVRDHVLWAEMATSRQNRAFFKQTIVLTKDCNARIENDPTSPFVEEIVEEMDASTVWLAANDWRRLHKRSQFYVTKNALVSQFRNPFDRLLLSIIFRLITREDYYDRKLNDGGIYAFFRQKYAQKHG
ncbi:hypothetical protein [Roseibium marinum]|uniref:Uncharacterized protein n=1 Tax=Roseibium marinum TaxID=281252 RepID=A0A2S3V3W5_9HYPH|nr:hypothetical protein [Roseibium marinum]POF34359.1 hypothetical protein CLV41_101813 [Roseibium marinum]